MRSDLDAESIDGYSDSAGELADQLQAIMWHPDIGEEDKSTCSGYNL